MSTLGIIIQARMGGERFPGKVLAPFLGEPMLYWQLKRLHRVRIPGLGGRPIVACPKTPANILLQQWCEAWHETCTPYDGPEQDVLGRYATVAMAWDIDPIIRVTADCPLLDPEVVTALWEQWNTHPGLDHLGIEGTWADGQDCEIFSRAALLDAHHEATAVSDREHVTPFLWRQPHRFHCATLPCERDCAWQQYSVDTPEDLVLAEALVAAGFQRAGFYHGWRDMDDLLTENAELRAGHDRRLPRNHRYAQQVTMEQGRTEGVTWADLRYGGRRQ